MICKVRTKVTKAIAMYLLHLQGIGVYHFWRTNVFEIKQALLLPLPGCLSQWSVVQWLWFFQSGTDQTGYVLWKVDSVELSYSAQSLAFYITNSFTACLRESENGLSLILLCNDLKQYWPAMGSFCSDALRGYLDISTDWSDWIEVV